MSLVLLGVQAVLLMFIVAISSVKAMCKTALASQSWTQCTAFAQMDVAFLQEEPGCCIQLT